ncbi:putative copper homeostasis (lipo)protein LpqS [Nocardia sp. NPDC004123]
MGRVGGFGRTLWVLLGSGLVLLAAIAGCALGDGSDHARPLEAVSIAPGEPGAPGPHGGESAHCDPHVGDAIRTASPGAEHAPEAAADPIVPAAGPADTGIVAVSHGVRGPPDYAVGGRMLLTRLCIDRR